MRLSGKKVFITAAGQGIGFSIAEAYIREGATVLATDINKNLLESVKGAEVLELDVTKKLELSAAIKEWKPDILVNCAGVVHAGSILQATDEDFDFAVSLNMKAMFHSIKAALPFMRENKSGSIINVASVVSSIIAAPNRFIYGMTKAGVIGLTKSVSIEYVAEGIRCNSICPGTVDTPSLHERLKATGDYKNAMKAFVARQPMGRVGSPEEIAALAIYLGSDESVFTTGQNHVVDGGWSVG